MAEISRPIPGNWARNTLAVDIPIVAKTVEDAQTVVKPVQDVLLLEDTSVDQMSNTFPILNQIAFHPYQSPVAMNIEEETKTESPNEEEAVHSNADEILRSAEQKQHIDGQDLEMSDQA